VHDQISVAPIEIATDRYPVVSHFDTVQGEGTWSGHAAYFIRLAGCDVGCPWCDTKESWAIGDHPVLSTKQLVLAVKTSVAKIVVITGGEPTMHDLRSLTSVLAAEGRKVHLETSGAYPLTGEFDWVTLSPKKYSPPVKSVFEDTHELKVVIAHKSDFDWAEEHRASCSHDVKLVLQPEWNSPHMLKSIVEYVKRNPDWTVSLQTHKYLNIL
jgi:7-carboxy-7-deazaguanine synthase